MDGFFGGYATTPRRSREKTPLSPFSTSPSQLQEVTFGANVTLQDTDVEESEIERDEMFGADITKSSLMRGKSVKEFDEQLSALQKENFNLKLRIYFLEERMGTTYRSEDSAKAIKKNIEYKVEIEELRRELEEKQDLLRQAVKAMELEEDAHKKEVAKKDVMNSDLLDKVEALQNEIEALTEMNRLLQKQKASGDMKIEDFKPISGDVQKEIDQLNQHIEDLEQQLALEREHSAMLEDKYHEAECFELRCKNLEEELVQKNIKLERLVAEVEEKSHTLSSYNLRIRTLEDSLDSKCKDVEYKDQEIEQQAITLDEQSCEIKDLRRQLDETRKELRQIEHLKNAVVQRDNSIADLDGKLAKCKSIIKTLEAKLDSIAHENKRHQEELETIKEQRRKMGDSDVSLRSLQNSSTRLSSGNQSTCSNISNRADPEIETVSQLKDELVKKAQQLSDLDKEHTKALGVIKSFISRTKKLDANLKETESKLEKATNQLQEMQLKNMKTTLYETFVEKNSPKTNFSPTNGIGTTEKENMDNSDDVRLTEDINKIENMTMEYEKQIQGLIETLKLKEEKLVELEKQCEATSSNLSVKDNRIKELENEVNELKQDLSQANKQLGELKTEKQKDSISSSFIEEKDKKITQLENDVRKHTFNLQGIVNNELWEKNREIEKLQSKCTETLKSREQEMKKLENEILTKDSYLKILKDKLAEMGINDYQPSSLKLTENLESLENVTKSHDKIILQNQLKISNEECRFLRKTVDELQQRLRNTPERDTDSKIAQLQVKIDSLSEAYNKSEKDRNEIMTFSTVLLTRLEELAQFLDSLLKHKSVLGVFGSKQRSTIKQYIDQSLSLSKSFMEDESLMQLSSITEILNITQNSEVSLLNCLDVLDESVEDPVSNTSLTYNNHLNTQKEDAINTTQNVAAEQAEIIKVLRSQIETLKKEIEVRDTELCKQTFDNQVLNDKEKCTESTAEMFNNLFAENVVSDKENLSDSDKWSEPDRDISQARIGLEIPVKERPRRPKIGSDDDASKVDSDETNTSEDSYGGLMERYFQYKKCAKEVKIKDTIIEELSNKLRERYFLEFTIAEMDKEMKTEKLQYCEEIDRLKSKCETLEKSIDDKEQEFIHKITGIENKWFMKMQIVEQEAEKQVEKVNAEIDKLKKKYKEEYILKSDIMKHFTEMKSIHVELGSLRDVLKAAEAKIKTMEQAERQYKEKLLESERISRDKIMLLKHELNESTLRSSQAVLEHTKVSNENLKLEQEIRKLNIQDNEKSRELKEKDNQLITLKNTLHKQLSHVENQKSNLQLKLSELETTNAELHNRLVRLQNGNCEPSSPMKITEVCTDIRSYGKHSLDRFTRQRSDMSGYHSEEHFTDENGGGVFNRSAPEGCGWFNHHVLDVPIEVESRIITNSSPDLGIESDQGRFSSLETNITTTRPLLQTLELTASMNNLLSTDRLDNAGHYCNILSHKLLEKQNGELHETVSRLQHNLQKACTKLSIINQNKKQVEKAVCKQIHKTSIVLRQARANLDSGSENEVHK